MHERLTTQRARVGGAHVVLALTTVAVLASCSSTSGGQQAGYGGARAPLLAAEDDVERIVRLLAPNEMALLANDPAIATKRSVDFERGLAEGLTECLSAAGLRHEKVEEVVAAKEGSVDFAEGNALSRGYVEQYGFGIVEGPAAAEAGMDAATEKGEAKVSDPDEQMAIADCEDAVLQDLYREAEKVATSPLMEKVRSLAAAAVAESSIFAATEQSWRECIEAAGYEAETVDDLIAGLELEGRETAAAARVEKEAAVISFDCAGGEDGIRADLQARVDVITEVVRSLSTNERAQLLELTI